MCAPLKTCCFCLPLEGGCVLISIFMLVYRTLLLFYLVKSGGDKDVWDGDKDSVLTADSTGFILFMVAGIIIPLFLLLGVCFGSDPCIKGFMTLELLWSILFVALYVYMNSGGSSSDEDVIMYTAYFYEDDADYQDDDYDGDDGDKDKGKTKKNDMGNFFKRHYWILPLFMILSSIFFLYVAYSLLRYWREEYDDYDDDDDDTDYFYYALPAILYGGVS